MCKQSFRDSAVSGASLMMNHVTKYLVDSRPFYGTVAYANALIHLKKITQTDHHFCHIPKPQANKSTQFLFSPKRKAPIFHNPETELLRIIQSIQNGTLNNPLRRT
jgi:hypothetical protein